MSSTIIPANVSAPEGLARVIANLRMSEDKKEWMQGRWLDQVKWFDRKAEAANRKYYVIRVIAITGGVLVPALVSLNPGPSTFWLWDWVKPAAFVVSLMVAASVGLDGFFHYGERWRHFRRTAELLKTEGWLFIEGGGRYKRHQHHPDFHNLFFSLFATKVEELVRRDVEVYLTRIVQEKPEDSDQEDREIRKYLDGGEDPKSAATHPSDDGTT